MASISISPSGDSLHYNSNTTFTFTLYDGNFQYFEGGISNFATFYIYDAAGNELGASYGHRITSNPTSITINPSSIYSPIPQGAYLEVFANMMNGTWGVDATATYSLYGIEPQIVWTNPNLRISRSGTTISLSWNAATGINGVAGIKYLVVYGNEKTGYGEIIADVGNKTSYSFTYTYYGVQYGACVVAMDTGGLASDVQTSLVYVSTPAAELGTPGKPTVTRTGTKITISWIKPSYANGTGSPVYELQYDLSSSSGYYQDGNYSTTSITMNVPGWNAQYKFRIKAIYSGMETYSSWSYTTFYSPTITTQPSITSMSPTSGRSTTINWSAATVSNQGDYTIYYQYFVGPSSTYSDSYHLATVTTLSASITEQQILNKCGSAHSGNCYIFVRAYWQDNTDSSRTGGWTTPIASTFYYTTLTVPLNLSIVQNTDGTFTASWTASSANSTGITYQLWNVTDGIPYHDPISGTTYTGTIPGYEFSFEFKVIAYYKNEQTSSNTVAFTFHEATLTWDNNQLTLEIVGDQVLVSWNPAIGQYGTGEVTYYLFNNSEDNATYCGTSTSMLVTPAVYNERCAFYVSAQYSTPYVKWSQTAYITVEMAKDAHYTIRCYVGDKWVDCVVYYYNGSKWIECTPYYYDGTSWKTCSF